MYQACPLTVENHHVNNDFDNRKRAFADVVTIDAWHESFSADRPTVDLHADVVFGAARIGGESESPVRFRLSIKRAEVVVMIPDSEPVSVDRKSVSRDAPEFAGRFTQILEQTSQTNAKGLSASISSKDVSASVAAEAGGQSSLSASKKLELSATIQFLIVTQSKTADGQYRWLVEPHTKEALEGRPWDATNHPRLTLVDQRKDRTKGIPPTVRVEVRCRHEDLLIRDIQIKEENLWQATKRRAGFKNKMAAAESYIRDHLSQEGLEVKNIEDIFGTVTLAGTTLSLYRNAAPWESTG
jgi:hypothetical protein